MGLQTCSILHHMRTLQKHAHPAWVCCICRNLTEPASAAFLPSRSPLASRSSCVYHSKARFLSGARDIDSKMQTMHDCVIQSNPRFGPDETFRHYYTRGWFLQAKCSFEFLDMLLYLDQRPCILVQALAGVVIDCRCLCWRRSCLHSTGTCLLAY